jgi:gamma-glutamyltranspeptidase
LPWKVLFEPAIDLCTNGFKVSASLAAALKKSANALRNNNELKEMYFNKSTNSVVNKGDFIKLPKLAETLRLISESNNSDVFYDGKLTDLMLTEMNENGKLF